MAQIDRAEYFYNQRSLHIALGAVSLALIALMGLIAYDDWNREWRAYQREFRRVDIDRTRQELEAAIRDSSAQAAQAREALEIARESMPEKERRLERLREHVRELRAGQRARENQFFDIWGEGSESLAVAARKIAAGANAEETFDQAIENGYEANADFYAAFEKEFQPLLNAYLASAAEIESAARKLEDLERIVAVHRERAEKEAQLAEDLKELEAQALKARMEYQTQKAIVDQTKFEFENFKNHHHGPADQKYLDELRRRREVYEDDAQEADKLQNASLALELKVESLRQEAARFDAPLVEAKRALDRAQFDVDRLNRRLAGIQPSLVNDAFRNLPLLDFINPSERINQVIIDGIREDYHFTDVRKIDRCHTCHVAIATPGYEDQPQPLTTHPNLELYVSDGSPHPLGVVGCTVCHEGNGMATSFDRAAHTPRDLEQQEEWERKYHWHRLHHWDFPMHKAGNYEASCMKCHQSPEEVPPAETLLHGHTLFIDKGCYACHAIDKPAYQNLPKPGPSLTRIAEKLTPEWTARWIADPWSFRPDSKMPRLFGLENMDRPEEREQDAAMIEAITQYLFAHSEGFDAAEPPAEAGDAARGRELVKTVGCMACHSIDDIAQDHANDPQYYQSSFAPNLSKIGTKVDREWLYNWLLNPTHYWAETKMPSLRLSSEEANHAAAYLLTLRDDEYLATPRPTAREQAVNDLLTLSYIGKMPEKDARAKLDAMPLRDKYLELGQKGIQFKNCFACHDIPGFENANPVVINFTFEGSKDKDQLNFGYIPHYHLLPEQIETAHHKGEPLLSYAHYEHSQTDRFLRERVTDPASLTGAATLRYPEVHGNAYVPYPTDPNANVKEVNDVFLPRERFDWFFNQIKNPHVWDRGVDSTYFNKMKMPQFGLTDAEAHALAVLVSGQVKSIIRQKHLTDNERLTTLAEGRAVLKRYNCYACHTVGVYEDVVTFETIPGSDRHAEPAEPGVDLSRHRVWAAENVLGKVEIWDGDNPTGKFEAESIVAFHENQWLVGDAWDPTAWDDFTETEGMSIPVAQMANSHYVERVPVWGKHEGWMRQYYSDIALAPPMLYREGEKVQPDWLYEWLNHVHTIRPNLSVRMPQYDFTVEEATALVRFFSAMDEEPWPYEEAKPLPTDEESLKLGEQVFFQLLQCNSCHPAGESLPTGQDTRQWGPNLALAQKRLKPKWLTEVWLPNPQGFYPGTYMPNNFYAFEGGELKPLLGERAQMERYIATVSAWLFHGLDPRQAIMDYSAVSAKLAAAQNANAPAAPASQP